jgi:peroxiredoxin
VIVSSLLISAGEFERQSGWLVKPEGICRDERCVPVPGRSDGLVDVAGFATRLGLALVHDERHGVWAVGPESGGSFLTSAVCPEITLPDLGGTPFSLSSLRGQKVLLIAWASWCGCRNDLPLWQALRTELHPRGLEIVTVALDTGGATAAGPWIAAAGPEHPSLIDVKHTLAEQLGVVNVPTGVWIDEQGLIVRPPETAPGLSSAEMMAAGARQGSRDQAPRTAPTPSARRLAMNEAVVDLRLEREPYQAALRDWVAHGADSPYALSPEDVVTRSRPRPPEVARAAASFELAVHLHRIGHGEDAVAWFRAAHRLQPDNWTYRRQAWSFVDPLQGPAEGAEDSWPYDSDWITDYRKVGAEGYYPTTEVTQARSA